MKSFALYIGLAVALVASCSTREKDFQTPLQNDVVFYASFEQPAEDGTRVYANEDLLLRWTTDDRVSIFEKNTYNQQFRFTGETGDNAGGFKKVAGDDYYTGNTISNVVSVYPYLETTKISESGVLTVDLPIEQHYAENTFGLGANTMVSVSADNYLQYKNVGGFLVFKLYGDGVSVSSLTLKGNNGEKLAGKATVTMPLDGTPTAVMAEDATTTITLTCETPVQLGKTTEESTQFWLVVPPVTFEDGFTLTVTNSAGESFEKTTTKSFSISRNSLSRMSALKVDLGNTPDPVESTLAEIAGFADGTTVKTMPVQVMAKTTLGVIIADETQEMFFFSRTPLDVAIGDRIQVIASKTTYRNLPELQNVLSLEILSTGESVTYPTPEDISARTDFDDPFFGDFQYVLLKGTLQSVKTAQYGNSYFVERLDDNTLLPFYFFYPSDYQNPEGYTIGDQVWATGYFAGFNPDSMCIMITSMTVENHPVPEAVDLGLPSGLKWASFNLGATMPEEFGDYYAWGETETKVDYSWATYKWCKGTNSTLTKYNCNSSYGMVDNIKILSSEDDAASVRLGAEWHIPNYDEITELLSRCSSEWETRNGVQGRKLTSSINGNSIFIPFAGYRSEKEALSVNSEGYYWVSELSVTDPEYTYRAKKYFLSTKGIDRGKSERYLGFPIRPVKY